MANDEASLNWLEDCLKGFEDVDWEEDWNEIGELCGIDSICCVQLEPVPTEPEEAFVNGNANSLVDCGSRPLVRTRSPVRTRSVVARQLSPSTSSCSRVLEPRFLRKTTDDDVEKAIVGRIPKNTCRSTNWGISIFQEWLEERKIDIPLVSMSDADLNQSIAHFVHEVVKRDGKTPYPPNSLYQIVVSIQRFLRENGRPDVGFFDNRPCFDTLRKSLDARMKELTAVGLGVVRKQAQPITSDMESILWEKGIFSRDSANGLLNIVYYYNCKLFGLRAGDEHRALCVEQFHFGYSVDGCAYMHFTGRNSKTYQGGLCHRKLMAKDLKFFASSELGKRDIVDCFQFYMSLIPSSGAFYRRPIKASDDPKFSQQVVGKNTLSTLVQKFCAEAGFEGFFSGHSGKVTCATELFGSMVDEQLIQHYTGHRSTDSVRQYKRPREEHFKKVSKILQPPPSKILDYGENEEIDENNEDKKEEKPSSSQIPLAPLDIFNNKFGSSPNFQASSGGNITFNISFN